MPPLVNATYAPTPPEIETRLAVQDPAFEKFNGVRLDELRLKENVVDVKLVAITLYDVSIASPDGAKSVNITPLPTISW